MKKNIRKALNKIVEDLILNLKNELISRRDLLCIESYQQEVYEVLSGQLARQLTMAIQFAGSSSCWTYDLAPVILRCMAENYINFSWIAKSPLERAKAFILHGVGQEKLILGRRKTQIINDGGNPEIDPVIEVTERWLSSQNYSFLADGYGGAWAGGSTRQRAEEAGCVDFYNYVYSPLGIASRNMWGHISKCNLLKTTPSSDSEFVQVPAISELDADFNKVKLAVKYTDVMIRKFDALFSIRLPGKSAYDVFLNDLNNFEISIL